MRTACTVCESFLMSTQPDGPPGVPEWDLSDRMRKALRHSAMSVEDMAAYLGVTRRSISNWVNGHVPPSKQTLRLWALRCGVDFNWLCHGDHDTCPGAHGNPVSAGQGKVITGTYSHRRPSAAIGARFLPAAA